MITKQLTSTGLMWTHYLQTCTYADNSFASPYELTYVRTPKVL